MTPVLEFANVGFEREGHTILSQVSLSVFEGERVALIGNNGAGKSTFLRLAAGVWKPSCGEVRVLEEPLENMSAAKRSQVVTWCAGLHASVSGISVEQFVAMSQESARFSQGRFAPSREEQMAIARALECFDAHRLANQSIHCLSSGEWQRVQLARAWVNPAKLLLLDEPSTALDLRHVSALVDRVKAFGLEHSAAVVFSSHDFAFVQALATRVVVLHNGAVAYCGSPGDLDASRMRDVFGVPFSGGLSPCFV